MTEQTEQPLGPLLDALGVRIELDPDQHITEAFVLCKVSDATVGDTALVFAASEGMDWITQRGILSAAQFVLDENSREGLDER